MYWKRSDRSPGSASQDTALVQSSANDADDSAAVADADEIAVKAADAVSPAGTKAGTCC